MGTIALRPHHYIAKAILIIMKKLLTKILVIMKKTTDHPFDYHTKATDHHDHGHPNHQTKSTDHHPAQPILMSSTASPSCRFNSRAVKAM